MKPRILLVGDEKTLRQKLIVELTSKKSTPPFEVEKNHPITIKNTPLELLRCFREHRYMSLKEI